MEQKIESIHNLDGYLLGKKIEEITSVMNQEGFMLTALSCTGGGTHEMHDAFLVFTKT